MKTIYAFFAARRYWKDEAQLQAAYTELATLADGSDHYLITENDLITFPAADCLVVIPMSGAVQKNILTAASQYDSVILYGAYIRGNASSYLCERMLYNNAAPTLMDTWAVLHRSLHRTMLALNTSQLMDKLQVLEAFYYVKGARLLKIGETEPWVVSNADNIEAYTERFGVEIVSVAQSELATLYNVY